MRNFLYTLTALLLMSSTLLHSQTASYQFETNDIMPGYVASTKQYNDSSLWGYIDGGADLYLEYGFKKLTHQEIVFRGLFFKADIFEMKDSAAAFGIYSISVLHCLSRDLQTSYNCVNPYQLQYTIGKYYVSITNIRGDTNAINAEHELTARILKKQVFGPFMPPAIFRSGLLAEYQPLLKVIAGPLGLQNGYPDWADRFEGIKDFYITLLPHADTSGRILIARINFLKKDEMKLFRDRSGLKTQVNKAYWKQTSEDNTRVMIELDDLTCLYLETSKKHKLCDDLLSAFDQVGKKAGEK